MRLALEAISALIPSGLLAAAVWPLLRCRHPREMFDRFPDGRAALRCPDCLRLRPNILYSTQPQCRLTQLGGPVTMRRVDATGIERWAEQFDGPITDMELFGVH